MSVLREILESIAEYFEADEENMKDYHDLQYYFDPYTINANNELPLICFDVKYGDDQSEQRNTVLNYDCRSYFRNFDIKLYTYTQDTDTPGIHNFTICEHIKKKRYFYLSLLLKNFYLL